MKLTDDIFYVGVQDTQIDLFESLYPVPEGMTYNSYLILDEKIAVVDSVEANFGEEWFERIETVLCGRREADDDKERTEKQSAPDYLIVQHMEPDHSANIRMFMERYPDAVLVASDKAFPMVKNYFGTEYEDRRIMIRDGDKLFLGRHKLTFLMAPLVHWPEVMVTYDAHDKVLFTADAFGTFGVPEQERWLMYQENPENVVAEKEAEASGAIEMWKQEARRYYFGIVGKFGAPVQKLLKKAENLDIRMLCPLHGPVIKKDITLHLDLYRTWSSYEPEEEGILIAYASVYGNTKKAAEYLSGQLKKKTTNPVVLHDLTRGDMSEAVANAFRFSKLVLASATYNGMAFPPMRDFIHNLSERGFRDRTVALVENGTWAPTAAFVMRDMLAKCKNLTLTDTSVRIHSVANEETFAQLEKLAEELTCKRAEKGMCCRQEK